MQEELDDLLPSVLATIGRGVQGRVVKSDLSPVPFPNGKGCLLAEVNALRDVQSQTQEELDALLTSVLATIGRGMQGRVVKKPHPTLRVTLPKSKGFGEGWGRAEIKVKHAA